MPRLSDCALKAGAAPVVKAYVGGSLIWPTGGTTVRGFDDASPPTAATADPDPYALAVEFYVTQAAWLSEIRFWQPSTGSPSSAVRSGALWDVATQANLSTTRTFPATVPGWNTLRLPSAIALTANQRYRAAVLHPGGQYAATSQWFISGPGSVDLVKNFLVVPSYFNVESNHQGSFNQAASMAYPNGSFQGGNYWTDVTASDFNPG